MSSRSPDVLVLGGGLIGLATARELALSGASVRLLERGKVGREASAAAAGMLAPLSEVRTAGPLFEACRDSRDRWPEWLAGVVAAAGREVESDASGALITARETPAEITALEEIARAAQALGEPARPVEPEELFRLVPDLTRETVRGLHLPGEHRVDNVALGGVLARAAGAAGVEIVEGARAARLERLGDGLVVHRSDGTTDQVPRAVLAGGAWSGGLEGVDPLPVRPIRGQMMRVTGVDWPWRGNVRVLSIRYGIPRGASDLLFGATLEDAGFEAGPTPAGLAQLATDFAVAFPTLAERPIVDLWAGFRPGTPDGLPVLGRYRDWPLWIAGGHYRNGILLAPWTAATLAPWILGDRTEPAAHAFAWSRFTG